jgi:hypothetical protein
MGPATVAWNLNQHKHVDYAFAMTSDSSQGATVDRALTGITGVDFRACRRICGTHLSQHAGVKEVQAHLFMRARRLRSIFTFRKF